MSLLEVQSVTKTFPGVKALQDVNFSLESGTVHGLLGENGSGKSTLINVIAGIHRPDNGKILLAGKEVKFSGPSDALTAGISMLTQEIIVVPNLSVTENVFMGLESEFHGHGLFKYSSMRQKTSEILGNFGYNIDPSTPVGSLRPWEMRIVQISKSLAKKSIVLALDEPTSALSEQDSERLLNIANSLKARGIGIIFVTHKIDEALKFCDLITVIRDGKVVGTVNSAEVDSKQIIRMMVGKELSLAKTLSLSKLPDGAKETPLLEAQDINTVLLHDASVKLYSREVVGLVGLVGSGKTELIRAILGLDKKSSGSVRISGEDVKIGSISDAKRLGIGYLPDDRRKQGLVTGMTIHQNITLPSLHRISMIRFILREGKEKIVARKWIRDLSIAARTVDQKVAHLSGGTQQKVVVAKWLETMPKILLCDEPTTGVDVGAREEIHQIFRKRVTRGLAVLLSTSDLDEALAVCDRIIVLRKGKIVDEFITSVASKSQIMHSMVGAKA